jgi:alpha-glucosidase
MATIVFGCCKKATEGVAVVVEEVIPVVQLVDTPLISAPPDSLHLDPFYKKYMNVNGIHVISSWRVPDSCFYAAYVCLKSLTDVMPPEVMESLTSRNTRLGIMARYEGTTDIPEHAHLAKDTSINWDLRARGLGGTVRNPMSTSAEENILAYQIDKYHAEDIMIHEFAHTIHYVGIRPSHPEFDDELRASLDSAVAKGRWKNVYASTNIAEYWAEGVQNWFNVNAEVDKNEGDGKHNKVNTREELQRYDPTLYAILARYFPEIKEQISRHKKVNLYDWTEATDN